MFWPWRVLGGQSTRPRGRWPGRGQRRHRAAPEPHSFPIWSGTGWPSRTGPGHWAWRRRRSQTRWGGYTDTGWALGCSPVQPERTRALVRTTKYSLSTQCLTPSCSLMTHCPTPCSLMTDLSDLYLLLTDDLYKPTCSIMTTFLIHYLQLNDYWLPFNFWTM